MKPILLLAFAGSLLSCTRSATRHEPLRLDRNIRTQVLEHLTFPHPTGRDGAAHFYDNHYLVQWFTNDELEYSSFDSVISQTFRSYYEWAEDTLVITGGYGWLTGLQGGFEIRVCNTDIQVFNKLCSANQPAYKLREEEPPRFIVNVPTQESQVILSELPGRTDKPPVLYGFLSFNGTNFYEQKDSLSQRRRMNMKVYFRSTPLSS
jgi:hypothetical protein